MAEFFVLTRIGSASISDLSANLGSLPDPIVATIPVFATGCLKGIPRSLSCSLNQRQEPEFIVQSIRPQLSEDSLQSIQSRSCMTLHGNSPQN